MSSFYINGLKSVSWTRVHSSPTPVWKLKRLVLTQVRLFPDSSLHYSILQAFLNSVANARFKFWTVQQKVVRPFLCGGDPALSSPTRSVSANSVCVGTVKRSVGRSVKINQPLYCITAARRVGPLCGRNKLVKAGVGADCFAAGLPQPGGSENVEG